MTAKLFGAGSERNPLMIENGYTIREAISDLMTVGLLQDVLLPENGSLVRHDLAETLVRCPDAAFFGAGLDSRILPPKALFVALAGEKVDGREFVPNALASGHWALTRPDSPDQPDGFAGTVSAAGSGVLLSAEPEKALARLAECWRRSLDVEVIAVTGTNGKTTTKDLMRAMLSAAGKTQATLGNLNNHLGLPLTLLNLEKDTRFAVIEMGASAVGEIDYLARLTQPQIAVITNASAAHLSEFGSLENIIQGKGELLDSLPWNGTAVLNEDSPGFDRWRARAVCPVVSWGQSQGDHTWTWENSALVLDGVPWPVPLPGRHNGANLCAAILACRALGVADNFLREGLKNFQGSDHRGFLVNWAGRHILDDSYNANPVSMLAAVRALGDLAGSGKTIAVLGAMAELGADSDAIHQQTGRTLAEEKLDCLLTVGPGAFPLAEGYTGNAEVQRIQDHHEAAQWLLANTVEGDRILIKGSRSSAMEKILHLLQETENNTSDGQDQ
jgi:UDP-N-acetylmuramoyl-tripeptide--D-alanyl-D-alanine ligase